MAETKGREVVKRRSRTTERDRQKNRAYQKKWRKKNRAKLLAYGRAWRNTAKTREYRLRHEYGIEIVEYERLLKKQGYSCAICGQPETVRSPNSKEMKPLSVDHDHFTNEVRGLLCHSCNFAIGALKESPRLFAAALRYLKRFGR